MTVVAFVGEPEFMERIFLRYNKTAQERRVSQRRVASVCVLGGGGGADSLSSLFVIPVEAVVVVVVVMVVAQVKGLCIDTILVLPV